MGVNYRFQAFCPDPEMTEISVLWRGVDNSDYIFVQVTTRANQRSWRIRGPGRLKECGKFNPRAVTDFSESMPDTRM